MFLLKKLKIIFVCTYFCLVNIFLRKKEKIQHCNFITEATINPTVKIAPSFPNILGFTMEMLLQLINDEESDVRMIADECLNRLIKAMSDENIGKILLELHKEIKKNGAARSLRAALTRFGKLCHLIRPHKGKAYITNLVPSLVKITEREEEMVHETLGITLPKIMDALGPFTSDNDIKILLKGFLNNVHSSSATVRRTTAICILTICLNSKKPFVFLTFVLNNLIDLLVAAQENQTSLILAVLGCLKTLIPHLKQLDESRESKEIYGTKKQQNNYHLSTDKLLKIYEIALNYCNNSNHNIINAALETLCVLLQNAPEGLIKSLLSTNGLGLFCEKLRQRSPSQLSVATTHFSSVEESLLESDLTDSLKTDIEKWIDESKLSVMNVTYAKTSEIYSRVQNENETSSRVENMDYTNITIGNISDSCAHSVKSESLVENLDKIALSDESSEKSFSQLSVSVCGKSEFISKDIDVGSIFDEDVPLIYCIRFICKSFLLCGFPSGLIPDKNIRVSVKSLALSCLGELFKIYPKGLLLFLEKNANIKNDCQEVFDVVLYEKHSDPQIRGAVRILIGSFIKSVILESCLDYGKWIEENNCCEKYSLGNFLSIILTGIQDEASVCTRQSLIALQMIIKPISESQDCRCLVKLLENLPSLAKNPYWLVKVKLLDVLTELNFITIQYVTGNREFQNKIVYNILFELLKDEDQRVRHICSNTITKIIPFLFFEQDKPNETIFTNKAIYYRNIYLSNLCNFDVDNNVVKKYFLQNMPFPLNFIYNKPDVWIEKSLSRILALLVQNLYSSKDKYLIYGCVETLCFLSEKYPTTVYKNSWGSFKNFKHSKEIFNFAKNVSPSETKQKIENNISPSADLLNTCIHYLTYNTFGYDFTFHQNLLKLTGNLFCGKCSDNLTQPNDLNLNDLKHLWDIFTDKNLIQLSEQFLNHVIKLLNIFSHVLDENVPLIPQAKTVLSNLPPASSLSPIKRRKSDLGDKIRNSQGKNEKEGDKKSDGVKVNTMGYFANIPHYMKIYELLRTAYNNYKITLDYEASENFIKFLKATLNALSQILEVATLIESSRIAEEILTYLKSTFNFCPSSTIQCIQQLLKSLFGSNYTLNYSEISSGIKKNQSEEEPNGFYSNILQKPYTEIAHCFKSLQNVNKSEGSDSVVMGYLHRREAKKTLTAKSSDKILESYIRIFEYLVIKSLKQYTVTSDVKLQCGVLQLLSQLIQLRVNYCLLDSEQIFIGFVLKQFEFLEEGQIPTPQDLIPKIFQFLVHLSYGKQHSKSIIVVPKLIQLCDGLMASGQNPRTHCIPALKPLVEDIFLLRNKTNVSDLKELEATKEVLLSMMLRLLEYHEILDLLTVILNDSRYCESGEKWLRWSKQIFESLIPSLKQDKIHKNGVQTFISLRKLIFTLNPNVFKSIDEVLIVLFQKPPDEKELLEVWVTKILALTLFLSQIREDILLLKMGELKNEFHPLCIYEMFEFTPDPLNVTSNFNCFENLTPETIFVRFLFRIVDLVSFKCLNYGKQEKNGGIIELFSIFLMYCLYIFQSGSHCKSTNKAIEIINNESLLKSNEINLNKINENFISLGKFYPLLTVKWCYFLSLVNYNKRSFWKEILCLKNEETPKWCLKKYFRCCINQEVVRTGACLVFCDYLSENISNQEQLLWMLENNMELIVNLSREPTVFEFLSSIHRSESSSSLYLNFVKKLIGCNNLQFRIQLINTVENIHQTQTGELFYLLVTNLLNSKHLAISRVVSNLACRKIEYLLTMSMEEVYTQLPKEKLVKLMDHLVKLKLSKKHETLLSLLNKLSTQFYDLDPIELDQRRTINPEYIKKLNINKEWYISQVETRFKVLDCNHDVAELLYFLDYESIRKIMESEFKGETLKDCFYLCLNKLKCGDFNGELNLLRACTDVLLEKIAEFVEELPSTAQIFNPTEKDTPLLQKNYTQELTNIFSEKSKTLQNLIPSVTFYLKAMSVFPDKNIPDSHLKYFGRFSVICLELISYSIHIDKDVFQVNLVDDCLICADLLLKQDSLSSNVNFSLICSSVNSIYNLVSYLLLESRPLPSLTKEMLSSEELLKSDKSNKVYNCKVCCHQLSILITWLEKTQNEPSIVNFLYLKIKSIIVSLSQFSLVNSYVLTPPSVWKISWETELTGEFKTLVPPLPIKFLLEIDVLEEFVYRTTLLGWKTRQQFEETWMCLLSVLNSTPSELNIPEEINSITHASSLAVQAITSLLIDSLYLPVPGKKNCSKLLHVPRDCCIKTNTITLKKLKSIHFYFESKLKEYMKCDLEQKSLVNVFDKANLEKLNEKYSYGQVSVKYLMISAGLLDLSDENSLDFVLYKKRRSALEKCGLDINSCIQFLLDLYSQWLTGQAGTPLRILHEVTKSIISISDLFTEKAQFSWLLEMCLEMSKTHNAEDEVLHQYLVVGMCKTSAVLMPDIDTLETVKKILVQNLKSPFISSRIAGLHGLLYILQGFILNNTHIGGISDEMQLFLPIATEYVLCNINIPSVVLFQSQDHILLLWALCFYLIENVEESHLEKDFVTITMQTIFNYLTSLKFTVTINNTISKGLERLIIKKILPVKLNNQIMKYSLNRMREGSHSVVLPATQLLLTCMYIECTDQLELSQKQGAVQTNPDNLVQTIEKISAIFDIIKKGYTFEVELLSTILPKVLNDFFPPSDILTKVIGEFLSPQQRHPKLLSKVVFQVFEGAIAQSQLSLLQDWVVFSLNNFTQSFSIGMATWCLTTFFISASTNKYLRFLFPYVQSRVGRYEYEDKRMLCIAGADFYHFLNDKQKTTFVETFQKVANRVDTPFKDLLTSL